MEETKETSKNNPKKKGKTLLIIIIIVLLLVVAFLFWWFNRKFDVTIKFNNGDENVVTKVKYLNKYDDTNLNKDLVREGYTFAGYHEVYYLNGNQIEKAKNSDKASDTICKNGFKLDSEKVKCVEEKEFDFKKTKIKKDTIIEALWSKNVDVTPAPQQVEEPVEKPKEEPKDTGVISLSVDKSCIYGYSNAVTLTATISGNTSNKTINWKLPKCYTAEKVSDSVYKLTRTGRGTMCRDIEELDVIVTASLNNGSSAVAKFSYEAPLELKVYDGNRVVTLNSDESYEVGSGKIEANVPVTFSATRNNIIKSTTEKTAILYSTIDDTITAKTLCGQSETVHISALVN